VVIFSSRASIKQQAAGHQRIALEGHGQGENEFDHQQPASGDRADGKQHHGIEDQEADDARLVPAGRVPEKLCAKAWASEPDIGCSLY
jgi:hypothetical protein